MGSCQTFRQHTGYCPYKCEFCDRSFPTWTRWNRHVAHHSDHTPFICDLCGKGFKLREHFVSHGKTHTGIKPFKCDVCGLCFRTSTILKTHMRTHTGEKPFKCEMCDSRFTQKSTLDTHVETHHGASVLYKCGVCEATFQARKYLYKHMRMVHRGGKSTLSAVYKILCDVCGEGFMSPEAVEKHQKSGSCRNPEVFLIITEDDDDTSTDHNMTLESLEVDSSSLSEVATEFNHQHAMQVVTEDQGQ